MSACRSYQVIRFVFLFFFNTQMLVLRIGCIRGILVNQICEIYVLSCIITAGTFCDRRQWQCHGCGKKKYIYLHLSSIEVESV